MNTIQRNFTLHPERSNRKEVTEDGQDITRVELNEAIEEFNVGRAMKKMV